MRRFLAVAVVLLFAVVTPANAFLPILLAPLAAGGGDVAILGGGGSLIGTLSAGGVEAGTGGATAIATLLGALAMYFNIGGKYNVPVQGQAGQPSGQMPSSLIEQMWCASGPCGAGNPYQAASFQGACDMYAHSGDGQSCTVGGHTGGISSAIIKDIGSCTFRLFCNADNGQTLYLDNQTTTITSNFSTVPISTPDGNVSMQKAPNGYTRDPRDPDDDQTADAIPAGGAPLRILTHDGSGNPVSVTVQSLPQGTTLDYSRQSTDANGNTQTTIFHLGTDMNGKIDSTTQQTLPNTQVDPNTGDTVNIAAPTSTIPSVSGGSQQQITFPNDYPDATQHQLQTSTNTKLDTLHNDLTQPATVPIDPTVRPSSDLTDNYFNGTFSGLQSWGLPARAVSCPTATFALWGTSYTIDAQCALWSSVAGTVSAVMVAMWAVVALFIVLGA